MKLSDLIQIDPNEAKVHLAIINKQKENPLDVYFNGNFQQWQERQTKKNFERKYVCSLIRYQRKGLWLFAGIYESFGVVREDQGYFYYQTQLTDHGSDLIGRLVVECETKGQNQYRVGEKIFDQARLYEIKPEPLAFSEFTNFKAVNFSRQQLELLFKHQYPSWRSALSSVAGIYLISDQQSGKLYVGSAYGEGGIWSRWESYANTFHGGNTAFRKLYQEQGEEGFGTFHYSILETCDIDLSAEQVIALESRWKDRLLSRTFGYNEN